MELIGRILNRLVCGERLHSLFPRCLSTLLVYGFLRGDFKFCASDVWTVTDIFVDGDDFVTDVTGCCKGILFARPRFSTATEGRCRFDSFALGLSGFCFVDTLQINVFSLGVEFYLLNGFNFWMQIFDIHILERFKWNLFESKGERIFSFNKHRI